MTTQTDDYQALLDLCQEYHINADRLSKDPAILALQLKAMLGIKFSFTPSKKAAKDSRVLEQREDMPPKPQTQDIQILDLPEQNPQKPPQPSPSSPRQSKPDIVSQSIVRTKELNPTTPTGLAKRAITRELDPSKLPPSPPIPDSAMKVIQNVLGKYTKHLPGGGRGMYVKGRQIVSMRQQGAPANVTGQLLLGYYLKEGNPEIMADIEKPPLKQRPQDVPQEIQLATYRGIFGNFELLKPQARNDLFPHYLTFKSKIRLHDDVPFFKADEAHLERLLSSLGLELNTRIKGVKIVKNRVMIQTAKNVFAFTPLFQFCYGKHVEITVYGQDARREHFELHPLPFSYMDDIKIEGKLDGGKTNTPIMVGQILFDSRMASPLSPVQYFKLAGLTPHPLRGKDSYKATFTGNITLNDNHFNIDVMADIRVIEDHLLRQSQSFLNQLDQPELQSLIEKIADDIINVWKRDAATTWYFSNIFYWKSNETLADKHMQFKYEVVALLERKVQGKKEISPFVFTFYPLMGSHWIGRKLGQDAALFIPSQQLQLFLSTLPYSINFNKLTVKQPPTGQIKTALKTADEQTDDTLFKNSGWQDFQEACRRLQKVLAKMSEFSIFQTEVLQEVYIKNMPKVIRYLILDQEPRAAILKEVVERHPRFKPELFGKEETVIKFIRDRLQHFLWARMPETEVMRQTLKHSLKLLGQHTGDADLAHFYQYQNPLIYTALSVLGRVTEKSLEDRQYLLDSETFTADPDFHPFRDMNIYEKIYQFITKNNPHERKIYDLLKLHDEYLSQIMTLLSQKSAGTIFLKKQEIITETDRLLENIKKTTNILKSEDSFDSAEKEEIQACYQIFLEIILAHFPVPDEFKQLKTIGRHIYDIPGANYLDQFHENQISLPHHRTMTILLKRRQWLSSEQADCLIPAACYVNQFYQPGVDIYNNPFPLFHSIPQELEHIIGKAWAVFQPIKNIKN